MKNFKIIKEPTKSLRERSIPITFPLDPKLENTLKDMLDYLKCSQDEEFLKNHKSIRSGVGIAAPQIGINKQMIALFYKDENDIEHEFMFINPQIISESVKQCYLKGGEGCLSVINEHQGNIYRAYKVIIRAFDLSKNAMTEHVFVGYGAIIVQHEIDHLKGILFYDHINKTNPFIEKDGAIAI